MVQMMCMTTKQKFDVEDPELVLLKNNRYAYKSTCPWAGKDGKVLTAWKFASRDAYYTKYPPTDDTGAAEAEEEETAAAA